MVKKADETFQTVLEQRGTVEAVGSSSITVKSEDGFTQAYTVNGDTKVTTVPAGGSGSTGDGGKRSRPMAGTIADIATGDAVRITAVKDGATATAQRIAEGAGDHPGLGRGHGHGKGHGKGPGRNQGSSDPSATGA